MGISAMGLLVVPSVDDDSPLVAIEAEACGTPVPTCRVGGLPESIDDGVAGRVVPISPDALAGVMRELNRSEDCLRAMSVAARRRAEEMFSAQREAQEYKDLYADVRELIMKTRVTVPLA